MPYVLLQEEKQTSVIVRAMQITGGIFLGLMFVGWMAERPPKLAPPVPIPQVEAPPTPTPDPLQPPPAPQWPVIRLEADENGNFYTDVTINGRKTQCLVDTGASWVTINKDFARKLGLKHLKYTVSTTTANGEVKNAPITLSEVTSGPITLGDVDALVDGGKLFGCLLGQTWSSKFHVEMSDGVMIIEDRRS